jgi:hypothetical protein
MRIIVALVQRHRLGEHLCTVGGMYDFGASTPRLFHNEGGAWVDITTSLSVPATTLRDDR